MFGSFFGPERNLCGKNFSFSTVFIKFNLEDYELFLTRIALTTVILPHAHCCHTESQNHLERCTFFNLALINSASLLFSANTQQSKLALKDKKQLGSSRGKMASSKSLLWSTKNAPKHAIRKRSNCHQLQITELKLETLCCARVSDCWKTRRVCHAL